MWPIRSVPWPEVQGARQPALRRGLRMFARAGPGVLLRGHSSGAHGPGGAVEQLGER